MKNTAEVGRDPGGARGIATKFSDCILSVSGHVPSLDLKEIFLDSCKEIPSGCEIYLPFLSFVKVETNFPIYLLNREVTHQRLTSPRHWQETETDFSKYWQGFSFVLAPGEVSQNRTYSSSCRAAGYFYRNDKVCQSGHLIFLPTVLEHVLKDMHPSTEIYPVSVSSIGQRLRAFVENRPIAKRKASNAEKFFFGTFSLDSDLADNLGEMVKKASDSLGQKLIMNHADLMRR